MKEGQKIDIYIGGKKIGETTAQSIVLKEFAYNYKPENWGEWEYYYRRRYKYFFRRRNQKITFETEDKRMRIIPRCKLDITFEVDKTVKLDNKTLTYNVDLSGYKKLK